MNKVGGYGRARQMRHWAAVAVFLTTALAAEAQQAGSVARRRQVIVSIPDRQLAVLEDGDVLEIFSVSVGAAASPSPAGNFQIVTKIADPTYYRPGKVIPPGKENPIGPRWIGLDKKGYGIHGTNEPQSIGEAASHGCIRMRNRDVIRFSRMVRVGDSVEIRAERDEPIAQIFGGDTTGMLQLSALTAGGQ